MVQVLQRRHLMNKPVEYLIKVRVKVGRYTEVWINENVLLKSSLGTFILNHFKQTKVGDKGVDMYIGKRRSVPTIIKKEASHIERFSSSNGSVKMNGIANVKKIAKMNGVTKINKPKSTNGLITGGVKGNVGVNGGVKVNVGVNGGVKGNVGVNGNRVVDDGVEGNGVVRQVAKMNGSVGRKKENVQNGYATPTKLYLLICDIIYLFFYNSFICSLTNYLI